MKLKEYMKCSGCKIEFEEAWKYQEKGFDVGLEFVNEHLKFFVINKNGKVIVK